MTLIVAVPTQDGVVFGSDGQLTTGLVRATGTKIYELNDRALWSASGELALIQRVEERIAVFPQKNQPLETIRDQLATIVRDAVQSLLGMDFRTQFFAQNPAALLTLHPGDFVFVEYRTKPRVLHVTANGTPEWVDGRFTASGSGELFAHALLAKYSAVPLTCEQAKVLTFKVIEEAIQVGAYGLGLPIDIWQIGANGIERSEEAELAALEDTAEGVRQREVELLVGEAEPAPAPAAPELEAAE